MPRIPTAEALGNVSVQPRSPVFDIPTSPIPGAISEIGSALSQIGDTQSQLQKRETDKAQAETDRSEVYDAQTKFIQFKSDWDSYAQDTMLNAPVGAAGLTKGIGGEFKTRADKFMQTLPPSQQQAYWSRLNELGGNYRGVSEEFSRKEVDRAAKAGLKTTLNTLDTKIVQAGKDDLDKTTNEALKEGDTLVQNLPGISPIERAKIAEFRKAQIAELYAKRLLLADPQRAARDLGAVGVPSGPQPAPSQRESNAMRYFQSRGYTPAQAAGIVGNLIQESSLNPAARNPGDGSDGSDSIGVGQWNSDRARRLREFAALNRTDWHDFNLQMAFVEHELATNESATGAKIRSARTVAEATAAFAGYERPQGYAEGGDPTRISGWGNRIRHASRLVGGAGADRLPPPASPAQLFERNKPYVKPDAKEFSTVLPPERETEFRKWVVDNKVSFDPEDKTSDYDMRGYWKAFTNPKDPDHNKAVPTEKNANDGKPHFTDYWKTPYHNSFSVESKFATKDAPRWINDHQLADKNGKVIVDESAPVSSGASLGAGTYAAPLVPDNPLLAALPAEKRLALAEQAGSAVAKQQREYVDGVDDEVAWVRAGNAPTGTYSPERVASALGEGSKAGAAIQREMGQAQDYAAVAQGIMFAPPETVAQVVAQTKSTLASPEDFADKQAHAKDIMGLIEARQKAVEKDPAAWVLQEPTVKQAYQDMVQAQSDPLNRDPAKIAQTASSYALATLAVQDRMGVPKTDQRILSEPSVSAITDQFKAPQASGQNMAQMVHALATQWGKRWPQVFGELSKDMPSTALVIGAMDLPSQAAASERLAEAAKVGRKLIEDSLPDATVTEVKNGVAVAMEDFRQTMANSPGAEKTYSSFTEAATLLALSYTATGDSASTAVARAYSDVLGKRYAMEGTIRIPTEWDAGAVTSGSKRLLSSLPTNFDLPRSLGGLNEAETRAAYDSALKKDGFWVTAPDETGLMIYDSSTRSAATQNGKPWVVPWATLVAMSKTVDRSRMPANNPNSIASRSGAAIGNVVAPKPADTLKPNLKDAESKHRSEGPPLTREEVPPIGDEYSPPTVPPRGQRFIQPEGGAPSSADKRRRYIQPDTRPTPEPKVVAPPLKTYQEGPPVPPGDVTRTVPPIPPKERRFIDLGVDEEESPYRRRPKKKK